MSRKTAAALLLIAVLGLGCDGSRPEQATTPFFSELARGTYFPDRQMLDAGELYTEKENAADEASWVLVLPRGLVLGEGWSYLEPWGVWSVGDSAHVSVNLRRLGPRDLYLEGLSATDPDGREQEVRVKLNGVEIGSLRVTEKPAPYRLPLPIETLRPGDNEIELVYGFHLERASPTDPRPIAFGLLRLGILSPGEEPDAHSAPALRIYRDQEVMVFDQPGSYVVPLRLPANARALELTVRADGRGESAGEPATLQASLLGPDGREQRLSGLAEVTDGSLRLELAGRTGRDGFLVLDADPGERRLTIRDVRLVSEVVGGETASAALEKAATIGDTRPPIVVIVLDAARADHFGVYGYARDTTPNIDRLARGALVFRRAIAECSYTVCSTPSLLTGLSFVQHGLISKSLERQPGVKTLAETLHEAGYATIGYTGNPNNSSITGTNQGFEELYEIWRTHPGHITGRALARLEQGTGERPLFLMLHYVPPHEPYAPDPEHDVFGDPAYRGRVTSDRELTRAIYNGDVALDSADLAELVSLYDGNLRMADAAVGEMLAQLERLGLYDQALIVITSDHGEAFMEHGQVGHNTTIYDEMLHVPLIVKLPKGVAAPPGLDLDRLATLADVVPTIHGLLGLELPPQVGAIDLLASRSPGPERVLFLRSGSTENPIYGVRSSWFKATVRAGDPPELYDLAADPGERHNVVREKPLLHAGLVLLLERALGEPAPLRAGLAESELSPESIEQLRALGYL